MAAGEVRNGKSAWHRRSDGIRGNRSAEQSAFLVPDPVRWSLDEARLSPEWGVTHSEREALFPQRCGRPTSLLALIASNLRWFLPLALTTAWMVDSL